MRNLYAVTAVLLGLLEVLAATALTAPHSAGREKRDTRSQPSPSEDIVIKANSCIEYIDDMKNKYVRDILGHNWNAADSMYPLGESNKFHLPELPAAGTHTPGTFREELVRQYGLMQHCLLAFEHLVLDLVFFPFVNSDVRVVDNVDKKLITFVTHLRRWLKAEGLHSDHILTAELGRVIYTHHNFTERRERAFVTLRDTRATLLHLVEVFETYD